MSGNISNLYAGIVGLKQDFKQDWKEDAKADWKVDWAHTAVSLPPGHVAISNTVAPAITGVAAAGSTLTCSQGTWLGTPTPTYTYQWFSSYSGQIAGATSATYVVHNADVFATLTCQVVATNADGSAAVRSAGVVVQETASAPANTVVPTITGEALIDTMLTASHGTWTGFPTPSYTYQWSSNGVAIPHATDKTYLTQQSDATFNVTVAVTATNAAGVATVSSAGFGPIMSTQTAPGNTALPAITGTAHPGQTLTVTPGTWTGSPAPTLTYQWLSNGKPLEVGEFVEPTGADIQVTPGTTTTTLPDGTSVVGSYTGVVATGTTYVVQASDMGNVIQVVEIAASPAGSNSATSYATAAVA